MRSKYVRTETDNGEEMCGLGAVIEQIWDDLDGQVSQARIRQVATGVAAKFKDATVTTHIPLFVRHLTREWLKEEIKRQDLNV